MKQLHFPTFPFDMIRLDTLGTSNSCYFHAILQAFHRDYINSVNVLEKEEFTRKLRNLLADTLDSTDATGKKIYDTLYEGQLPIFVEEIKEKGDSFVHSEFTEEWSLGGMIKNLRGNGMISESIYELVSNYLDIDIYLLNEELKDIYYIPNSRLLYKNRNSVVISIDTTHLHYSTVGLINSGKVETYFSPTHEFIAFLNEKIMRRTGEIKKEK